jgi:hypothetical protein
MSRDRDRAESVLNDSRGEAAGFTPTNRTTTSPSTSTDRVCIATSQRTHRLAPAVPGTPEVGDEEVSS